jgi:hypothetical protein
VAGLWRWLKLASISNGHIPISCNRCHRSAEGFGGRKESRFNGEGNASAGDDDGGDNDGSEELGCISRLIILYSGGCTCIIERNILIVGNKRIPGTWR